MVVMGVDLRSSPKLASALAALDCSPAVVSLDWASTDDELVEGIQEVKPSLVAIGTPLGLPEGLCCLETSCECRPLRTHRKGRHLELELARMGISCFFTGKGSIIRNLIYRGIRLRDRLAELGFEVIEVYPHATKVILFGDGVPPKNSGGSLDYIKERLPGFIGGLQGRLEGLDQNGCDALINGYTAVLHRRDQTDVLGRAEEGWLTLPRLVPEGVRAPD